MIRGAVVSTRIGFGRTIVRPFRSSWTRGRYTPSGTTRSRLSRPSHVYETRPAGSRRFRTTVRTERPLAIEDVERHRLASPEDERDDRDVARALADGREDAIDPRAGDRAPLELQPLGDGERRRSRPEQGEDDQELWPPRHGAEPTASRRYEQRLEVSRERARTAPHAQHAAARRRRTRRTRADRSLARAGCG